MLFTLLSSFGCGYLGLAFSGVSVPCKKLSRVRFTSGRDSALVALGEYIPRFISQQRGHVQAPVLRSAHHCKVLWSVVVSYLVYMVNNFVCRQQAPVMLFPDEAMLQNVPGLSRGRVIRPVNVHIASALGSAAVVMRWSNLRIVPGDVSTVVDTRGFSWRQRLAASAFTKRAYRWIWRHVSPSIALVARLIDRLKASTKTKHSPMISRQNIGVNDFSARATVTDGF